ncbi:3-phosphoshikimate 1-carboxyvinyltransferase [Streptococcus porcinus]|uniref:3-phosphoshikimate 1-carboxyvinyltransferase n=1 Tax=Streptococcus porcinus str. Jelinkova 176 TaxID=873448 RepID=A0ABN0CUI3_STRPO|nr:3-phosphoshikimate 1-carboxyvinyltransferase [Streptococcus porcinus]EGJ26868.1 3-phosphoshikimate 1-carboxyvinyltransferase [Streptococcus porcinus str. Jelinkova 176]SQG43426.1 3-phosphoshikimate 1-carboxyvinyltransferase [Streptococcus porcinus]
MKLKTDSRPLRGCLTMPGDKSISHRAIIFGAIAEGITEIEGLLKSHDVNATISAFRQMGVLIEERGQKVIVHGQGFSGLKTPQNTLEMGNSGTSMRLLCGVIAAQDWTVTLKGDASLSKRPMDRVAVPLELMGAEISGQGYAKQPPITVKGKTHLKAITYHLPVASAQVKSAILLAALQTRGQTKLVEKAITRNHTEEMIRIFGGQIQQSEKEITIKGPQSLRGQKIKVAGDISSAAFWLVAGLIVPGSDIRLENVGINETRTGILDVIKNMGGQVAIENYDSKNQSAHLRVTYSELRGTEISGALIPRLIDELPIIALLATQAKGHTIIKDAAELRLKETNRITVVVDILQKMGAQVEEKADGMIITGGQELVACQADAQMDHRIGMMATIAALLVKKGTMTLKGADAIATSYPNFFADLERLQDD